MFCRFAGNYGESLALVQKYYFQEVLGIAAINISHCKIVEEE